MGLTSDLKIPYVNDTDLLPNYPSTDQLQAERIEAALSVRTRVMDPFTARAGWKMGNSWVDAYGPFGFISVTITLTGAPITLSSEGYAYEPIVADYDESDFGQWMTGPIITQGSARIASFYMEMGHLRILSVAGGETVPIGTNTGFHLAGIMLLEPNATTSPSP